MVDPREFWFSRDREKMLEHIFLGELTREAWFRRRTTVEILRSEVDSSGYDLVLEQGSAVRHVQLKASRANVRRASQPVNVRLSQKVGGCVVWILYDPEASGGSFSLEYRFFGREPHDAIDLEPFELGRQTRRNAYRVKPPRPSIRLVPRSRFEPPVDIHGLYDKLFPAS